MVVNMLGGPGSGKTLMAHLLFAELSLKGKVVEYVPEFAKQLVWKKDWEALNNQLEVCGDQYDLMLPLFGNVDYVITDGPMLHGMVYNRLNKDNMSNWEEVDNLCLGCIYDCENINIFVERHDSLYQQAGRIQNMEEAKEVDKMILGLLDNFKFPYHEVRSGKEDVNRMVDIVLSYDIIQ